MPRIGSDSEYYQHQAKYAKLVEFVTSHVRKQIFQAFMHAAKPQADAKVLDIGVTSNDRSDCNLFEALYPYPHKITAVGLEDASFLESEYPGLKYVKADALNLPFADKSFDIAVSWAVIEHLGSRKRQLAFVQEMSRVSRAFFLTTPNRWYPIEFHTVMPFVHWLPPKSFRQILRLLKMPFYATEETLNLLDRRQLLSLLPETVEYECMNARLLGPVSNLVVFARDKQG